MKDKFEQEFEEAIETALKFLNYLPKNKKASYTVKKVFYITYQQAIKEEQKELINRIMENKCACGCKIKQDCGYLHSCTNPECKISYVLDMDGEISEYGTIKKTNYPQPNEAKKCNRTKS
ncbi:hypothetical protein LCGC14_1696450 [marine sediment metagenome]|uniref:Uncharacterized protein n=1 Tax=marine sediment metagenome TaxID=412755 RepID=A0A0F9HJ32_9ZZZZ